MSAKRIIVKINKVGDLLRNIFGVARALAKIKQTFYDITLISIYICNLYDALPAAIAVRPDFVNGGYDSSDKHYNARSHSIQSRDHTTIWQWIYNGSWDLDSLLGALDEESVFSWSKQTDSST